MEELGSIATNRYSSG